MILGLGELMLLAAFSNLVAIEGEILTGTTEIPGPLGPEIRP